MITIIVEVIVCLGILIYYYLTYRTTHEFTIGNDCCIFVAIPAIAYAIPKIYKTKVKTLILPLILSYIGDFKCGELLT